ncbi:DUF4446 family protein [Patescibacteria group bacterium]|nr:MAG: DUF4446 family protein [Patescibacteria group bacterium]
MLSFIEENQSNLILILLIAGIALLVWVVYLQVRLYLASKRHRQILKGVKIGNLEEALLEQVKKIEKNSADIKELSEFAQEISDTADICIKKVALIRFNPFEDAGGDQSFAVEVLDTFDNGVIISSLHSRDGTRVYAKPITKGRTKHHLSDEEKAVLKKAIEGK